MKKIWTVSTVKNEGDSIESFCRYTLQICDGLLIRDDGSVDNTKEIIKQLIGEGLPVVLFESRSDPSDFTQYQSVLNEFARQAFEVYSADWVLPLDADEFLFCPDYTSPRNELEKMDESLEYRIECRNYLFEQQPEDTGVFLPFNFQSFLQSPKEKRMVKTVLSRKLYFENQARIAMGHHHLEYNTEDHPKTVYTDRILLAHYPFRNIEQMLAKVITGELHYQASPDRKNCGLHWNLMYNAIKESKTIDAGLVRRFSLVYSGIFETSADLDEPVQTEPFRTTFFKEPISLKYTKPAGNYEYLRKILAGMEEIIENNKKAFADYEKAKDDPDQCRNQAGGMKKNPFGIFLKLMGKIFYWSPGKKRN